MTSHESEVESAPVELSVEQRAEKQGWAPLEKFKGDPEDWVSAKEFLRVGSLFEANKVLKTKLAKIESVLDTVVKTTSKAEQRAYEKALHEIENRKLQAEEDGDIKAYKQAELAERELARDAPALAPVNAVTDTPEWKDFTSKNAWADVSNKSPTLEDLEKRADARAITLAYTEKHPDADIASVLSHVEKKIQRLYPSEVKADSPKTEEVEEEKTEVRRPKSNAVSSSSVKKPKAISIDQSTLSTQEKEALRYLTNNGLDTTHFIEMLRSQKKGK